MNPSDFFMYIMQSKNKELAGYLDDNYLQKAGVKIDSKLQEKIQVR